MVNFEDKRQESLVRELKDYMFILPHQYSRLASIYNNIGAVYFEMGTRTMKEKAKENVKAKVKVKGRKGS